MPAAGKVLILKLSAAILQEVCESTQVNSRKVYIDFIKIIAILMVLFNHTGAKGFVLFIDKRGSFLVYPYLFISIFIKIAVPLFFMSSGALLLGKTESIVTILKKRVVRFAAAHTLASTITYVFKTVITNQYTFNVYGLITDIFSGNVTAAYWYLYAYFAFLCSLPFLRILAKNMKQQHYIWLFLLYGLYQLMIIVEWLIWKGSAVHDTSFSLFSVINYVFYPLIGYYIDSMLPASSYAKKNTVSALLTGVLAIIVSCLLTVYYCEQINEWNEATCQRFYNSLIFVPAIAVFYSAKYRFQKVILKKQINRILTVVGSATFGIYLFEYIYRFLTRNVFSILSSFMPVMLACWGWVLSAAFIGFIIPSSTFQRNKNAGNPDK